jgi:hypothetical protein
MVEPFSRIVMALDGTIAAICHLDFERQYNDPAFAVAGCANADMTREEYDLAASGVDPVAIVLGSQGSQSSSAASLDDVVPAIEPDPALVARKCVLALALSKLDPDTQGDFIAGIQARIDAIDAEIAAAEAAAELAALTPVEIVP